MLLNPGVGEGKMRQLQSLLCLLWVERNFALNQIENRFRATLNRTLFWFRVNLNIVWNLGFGIWVLNGGEEGRRDWGLASSVL